MRMKQTLVQEPVQFQTAVRLCAPTVSLDASNLVLCVEESGVRILFSFVDDDIFALFLRRLMACAPTLG